jgi:hypothetical protein
MKLVLFNEYIPGVVNRDNVFDLSATVGKAVMDLNPAERMPAIIAGFDLLSAAIQKAAAGKGVPLASVRLRAPIPRPGKMLFGLGNYRENVKGALGPLGLFLNRHLQFSILAGLSGCRPMTRSSSIMKPSWAS